MKKIVFASTLLASSMLIANANSLYQPCVQCHGAAGEKVALGKSKIIKDMSKADFIASMKGYKDGSYGGPMKAVMKPQVIKLSDADIKALADFIVK